MTLQIRSSSSPQRQLPLFQSPGRIFGMSKADRLSNALDVAQDARKGMLSTYAAHCAGLGRANTLSAEYRQAAKRDAFIRINLLRKALRENARKIADMQAELLAPAATFEVA